MSAKCVPNLGRSIGHVSIKHHKEYCNSFPLHKGGKAQCFLNLLQMNNYGEYSIMTCCHKVLGYILCKTGSIEGELRSNGSAATQNCLENTTTHIWEYSTNVNGTVGSRMVFPWVFWNITIQHFGFTWLLITFWSWQLPIRDNLFIKSFFITLSRRNLFLQNFL